VSAALLQTYWAPFACADLEEVQSIAASISILLSEEHPKLYHALQEVSLLDHPHFLLSWLLTWFLSCLTDISTQMYLVMLFLKGKDALTPLYFSAALVLRGADGLFSSLQEFRQRCAREHVSPWKDYVYGLLFQRISMLPTTLLEPPSPPFPLRPSVEAETTHGEEEDDDEGKRGSAGEESGKEVEKKGHPTPKDEEGSQEATRMGAPKDPSDGATLHLSTGEEEEEDGVLLKKKKKVYCPSSTSLLLMELTASTSELRTRYPLQRVDRRKGGAAGEGGHGEHTSGRRRSGGSGGYTPFTSSERQSYISALRYAFHDASPAVLQWFFTLLLHLSGILPRAIFSSLRSSRPSPPPLQRSIQYVRYHAPGESSSSSSPHSTLRIFPGLAKRIMHGVSRTPSSKAMVTISVVLVVGLSLLALQQRKALS